MGDLGIDTAIAGGDGRYSARLSREWEIWGPMGGYVAAFALRAAGLHCGRPRPASLVGHYLGVANFDDPISIETVALRTARTATSVRTTIAQNGQPIFEALVWGVAEGLVGLEHEDAPMPSLPHWRDCPTIEERVRADGLEFAPFYPFWANLEQRPSRWRSDWMSRAPREEPPVWHQWLRFTPTASFADPWLDACRLLILVDVGGWPAASATFNQEDVLAPSIDLACHFHRIRPDAEWLFLEGHSPSSSAGLVGSHQRVWSDDGQLLASGVSQLLCRPRPQPRS